MVVILEALILLKDLYEKIVVLLLKSSNNSKIEGKILINV